MPALLVLLLVMVSVTTNSLQPCPSSPNCVSSQETDNHFVEPLVIIGEEKAAFGRLLVILGAAGDAWSSRGRSCFYAFI